MRQLETPDHLRGRMVGISMLFFMGGPQLGEFEAGVVAQWLGARLAVVLGGAASLVSTACIGLALAGAPRVPPGGVRDGRAGRPLRVSWVANHRYHRPDDGRPKEPMMTGKTETSKLETLDKERVLHPSTSIVDHLRTGPRIMTEGSGVMLTDATADATSTPSPASGA